MWSKWTPLKHAEWEHVLNINLKLFYLSQGSHLFFFFFSAWCLGFLFYYELLFFSIPTFCLCSCHCSYYYHSHNATNVEIFFNYSSVSVLLLWRSKGKQTGFQQWSYTFFYKLLNLYQNNVHCYVYFSRYITVKREWLQALQHSSKLPLFSETNKRTNKKTNKKQTKKKQKAFLCSYCMLWSIYPVPLCVFHLWCK